MSKSLGTGVDPMGIIETLGADALRYTLLSQTGENQDIRYSERRTEEARNFANKIWNAVRFILMNVEGEGPAEPAELEPTDIWLLSRLYTTEQTVRAAYEAFDLQGACQALYRFFWAEMCDWYIEVSKSRLADPATRQTPQWVLLGCIECFIKMLHPVMPHITEEIYSHLPLKKESEFLMTSSWPKLPEQFFKPDVEADVQRAFDITRALRALRASVDLQAMKPIPTAYYEGDLGSNASIVSSQAWVQDLRQGRPDDSVKYISTTVSGVDLFLPVEGLVDMEKECGRLAKEEQKLAEELEKLEARLSNPMFVERAKPEVVEREKTAATDLQDRLAKIREMQSLFGC